ncbi:MAG: NADH-quinone oxidoreductase subunit NuoE [Dehalococcoidia bacterium]|nr:MAG: NADH-quinone oxidoreductase subunit NuoE [Dehalococcoidia bacterium]
MELDTIDRIIDEYDGEDGILIQVLQDVQAEYNWLPKEALERVCERLGIPLTQAYSVASFYKAFSLVPRGRHIANVCMGTACHVRGAPRILEKVEDVLGIKAGETTQDRRFSLERVNCLGCCALGPVMVIDGEAHGKLAVSGVEGILDGYE